MTIKIEVDGLLKKYEDNDSKNLAKASKAGYLAQKYYR